MLFKQNCCLSLSQNSRSDKKSTLESGSFLSLQFKICQRTSASNLLATSPLSKDSTGQGKRSRISWSMRDVKSLRARSRRSLLIMTCGSTTPHLKNSQIWLIPAKWSKFMSEQPNKPHLQPKTNVCGSDMYTCTWIGRFSLNIKKKTQHQFTKKFWRKFLMRCLPLPKFGFSLHFTIWGKAIWHKRGKYLGKRLVDAQDLLFLRLMRTLRCDWWRSIVAEQFLKNN